MCLSRTARAVLMRSSKKAWFTSTRSGDRTRTLILDFELIKAHPEEPLAMVFHLNQGAISAGWVKRSTMP